MVVCSEVRSWLWNTLEYPWTSRLAQLLAFFSLSMIVLSTLTFIISTADELQQGASNNPHHNLIYLLYIIYKQMLRAMSSIPLQFTS